ncbi:hypothetical protein G7046_g5700 [Stylonectria norvegica]|nr:hypothetical protein G7046_g5700 [Stylonectria norvegica]
MTITTTQDGSRTTYTTTAATVKTPDAPTSLPSVDAGDGGDQAILKYFPSAVPKVTPTSSASSDSNGHGGGLSKGALAGIIAGAVAFLIIVLVTAFIIIRHLNKIVAAVSNSKESDSSRARPQMKEFKPTDSEVDALSVDPLIVSPRPAHPRTNSTVTSPFGLGSPEYSSNEPTPSGASRGYERVSGSGMESPRNQDDYFNSSLGIPHRFSQYSTTTVPTTNRMSQDSHGSYSQVPVASGSSDEYGPASGWNHTPLGELEANPYVPELSNPSSTAGTPGDERRRSTGSSSVGTTRPRMTHQRKRSDQRGRSESTGQPSLGILSEEMHGFHGPSDHLIGQTDTHRPGTRSSAGSAGRNLTPNAGE